MQKDIECYIHNCDHKLLLEWVRKNIGAVKENGSTEDTKFYKSDIGAIMIFTYDNEPTTSIWFNTPDSPWNTDVDCARQIAKDLQYTVMCDPGEYYPEIPVQSDIFLEVTPQGEKLFLLEE